MGVGLTAYAFANPDTMATAYMISGGLNGGYSQELVELAFIGNALLYMADIAMGCAGIVGIISLLAMATPVGIILGAGLAVLTIIAMHMINEALEENFRQMDAYINGEISGDEIVHGFIWNVVLTAATFGLAKGIEKGVAYAAEQYLTKVVGSRLAGGLLSEGVSPTGLVRAVKNMKTLGYTDDFIRELADNISAEQLIRMNRMNRKGLGKGFLDILFGHSRQLGNYSDDLIWQLERAGSYTDDILKLVDNYGEAFTRQMDADDLSRLGGLVNKGLTDDVVDAVIKHADHFADYSDDTIKKIAESGCNAERILTQIDNYAKDFTEDLTAGQLKRLDDILEQGITPEQFEVLLNHAGQLDDYTDEVIGLWRSYTGNGDDFLRLVDEFGDEFVEAFQKNGDEAVEVFNEKIKEVTVRLFDDELDKEFLANSTLMKNRLPEWACNIGNFAYSEVNIAIVDKKQYFAHSSVNSMIPSVEGSGISVKPESSPFNPMYVNSKNIVNGEGAWLRDVDTEYKILSEIQSRLGSNFEATGSIKLYTELEPCLSCQSVIKKFKEMYPNIRIEIIYSKGV